MNGQWDLERSVDLFHRAKAGDRDALNSLAARYHPRLLAWASGRLAANARHLVETTDIVQQVLLRFLATMSTFEPRHDGAVLAYLRTALLRRIYTATRDARRRPGGGDPEALDKTGEGFRGESAIDRAFTGNTVARYERALEKLTELERVGVILKVEFGYSPADLAVALGSPSKDAARMFVKRAMEKVAREMGDERP